MDQCQDVSRGRQCPNEAVVGFNRCDVHLQKNQRHRYDRHMYHLKQAQQERLAQFKGHDESRSLQNEIALTRSMIQTIYDGINSDTDMLANVPALSELFLKLERLLKTSHQIEKETGALLGKDVVILLSQELFQIISEELKEVPGFEEILRRIAMRFQSTIEDSRPLIEHHG